MEFWNFHYELSVENEIILKGFRIVIAHDRRTELLKVLHVGHTSVEKTFRKARDVVFWPGLTKDITDLILNCNICLESRTLILRYLCRHMNFWQTNPLE